MGELCRWGRWLSDVCLLLAQRLLLLLHARSEHLDRWRSNRVNQLAKLLEFLLLRGLLRHSALRHGISQALLQLLCTGVVTRLPSGMINHEVNQ